MNYDVICLYYSRTGKTERVAHEIAAALDCDVVEIQDRAKRDGALGALRCGLDAMRKKTMVKLNWTNTKKDCSR